MGHRPWQSASVLVPVDQSWLNQYFILAQTVERKLVIYICCDTVEYIGVVLHLDGFKNRFAQIVTDCVTILTHSNPPSVVGLD